LGVLNPPEGGFIFAHNAAMLRHLTPFLATNPGGDRRTPSTANPRGEHSFTGCRTRHAAHIIRGVAALEGESAMVEG